MRNHSLSESPPAKLRPMVILIVFALPLLYFWFYCIWVNPSENHYTIDTEFEYFLNSLAVFKGGSYTYVDHPGTPLEEIGTIILGATYPFLANVPEGFISFHLQNPGIFLNITHYFLIFFNLICIFIFFKIALTANQWGKAISAAALATMYFAIHPLSLDATMVWNHNSFGFPFGTLVMLFLFKSLDKEPSGVGLNRSTLVGLGLGAGILASVTIYMATWMIGILIAILIYYRLQNLPWRRTILAVSLTGVSSVLGFFLAVLPVIDRMAVFWNWIYGIVTHQSKYLAVPQDESMPTRLANNLIDFYNILPILFLSIIIVLGLALLAFFLWRKRLSEKPGGWAILAGLSIQAITLTIVFLDHPLREAYFLSIAAILPVLTMALLMIWEYNPPISKIMSAVLSTLVVGGTILTSVQSISTNRDEASSFVASQIQAADSISNYAKTTDRRPGDLVIFWMYGTYSQCWGLRLGDSRARYRFVEEINRICPNQYYLGNNLRSNIQGNTVPLQATKWDMIFTCEKYLADLIEYDPSIIIERYPAIRWVCGNMVIVYRK